MATQSTVSCGLIPAVARHRPLAHIAGGRRKELGALNVVHGIEPLFLCSAPFHLLETDILDSCLDPPEVTEGIAHAPNTITPEQVRHLGHRGCASAQCLLENGLAFGDVQPEESRGIGPMSSCVKHHYHRIADSDLGMTNGAIIADDPGN